MKVSTFAKDESKDEPLYIQLYMYYRELIESGILVGGTKLPSIRRCCDEFSLSKTTVETAYQQLAAEGYILPKAQSGYYVSDVEFMRPSNVKIRSIPKENDKRNFKYDLTSTSLDKNGFDFTLWRRYIKGAFRQSESLTSYGEAQGELELRQAISKYVGKYRSVVCSEKQVIIGAGTQSLIHILCGTLEEKCTVGFIGSSFEKGEAIFNDHGFKCMQFESIPDDLNVLKENNVRLIYISPSHFTAFGDILPINGRMELISYARNNNCLIIEDDYDSEFRYYSKPVPSLQGIAGGENVVYLATFSKLLLPSIRISFMIFPPDLIENYENKSALYNQTASKLEQIAVCRFIRDGHLNSQIKKQRKIFNTKADRFTKLLSEKLKDRAKVSVLPAGYLVMIEIREGSAKLKCEIAEKFSLKLKAVTDSKRDALILSCTSIAYEEIENVAEILSDII